MAKQYVSLRNLKFLLHEVLEAQQLTQFPYYQDYSAESMDQSLEAALKLADALLYPAYQEMDRTQAEFANGQVTVHPNIRKIMDAMGEGGWLMAMVPAEGGGLQMPAVLSYACTFVFGAANKAATMFPGLTMGAARLIRSFGNDFLKQTYMAHMDQGAWQGTMCLTEPQAGSSLSDVVTSAELIEGQEGSYKISGQKIFISAGDYTDTENVVHLVLARIKGAPAGTKGISLFVVPKMLSDNGQLHDNHVSTAGIYHKMGEKGTPAAHIIFEASTGYLVGEANRGLPYMFQMMNEARLGVGLGATSLTSAAYYASLEYAQERPQGRKLGNRNLTDPQIHIIEHPDVRRMLLLQKAVMEGSLNLILTCGYYQDMEMVTEGEEKENWFLLLDLLTPIAKSYPSEAGILAISAGMQTMGGYGYTQDFALEQHYRDIKISAIYEGTTGIQAQDLLGRKVTMHNGKAVQLLAAEIVKTIQNAQALPSLKAYADTLAAHVQTMQEVTLHLVGFALQGQIEVFMADATVYLELFSLVTIGWQWLLQGIAAQKALDKGVQGADQDFYSGKMATLAYFFLYELPRVESLAHRLKDPNHLTVDLKSAVLV